MYMYMYLYMYLYLYMYSKDVLVHVHIRRHLARVCPHILRVDSELSSIHVVGIKAEVFHQPSGSWIAVSGQCVVGSG